MSKFHQFTVDDLQYRYNCKNDTELADFLGWTKGAISLWRSKGIPENYQRFLNVESRTPRHRKELPVLLKQECS